MTNVLGVVVLLCVFVLAHVVLALMSFRMISLVPHNIPRLIGFLPANRVDMDGFSRDAALVGAVGALRQIEVAGQAVNGGKRAGVPRVASRAAESPMVRGVQSEMDSTLRASTDISTPRESQS